MDLQTLSKKEALLAAISRINIDESNPEDLKSTIGTMVDMIFDMPVVSSNPVPVEESIDADVDTEEVIIEEDFSELIEALHEASLVESTTEEVVEDAEEKLSAEEDVEDLESLEVGDDLDELIQAIG